MKKWRLILDGKNDGFYNMAADEAILLYYSYEKEPTLRIYGWQRPFISLGCHQNIEDVLISRDVPFVRRITGGAAILHDCELTYSIVCSTDDLGLPRGVKESYKILCSFLIDFYRQLGIEVKFAQDNFSASGGRCINYCYAGAEEFDLVVNDKKIGGNAQRRKKNIVFQQGSIPREIDFSLLRSWVKDVGAIEETATFLNKLTPIKEREHNRLSLLLADSFQRVFSVNLIKGNLQDEEKRLGNDLMYSKYSREEWNVYRNSRRRQAKGLHQ